MTLERRNTPSVKARTGLYEDGRLGEVFVTVGKRGLVAMDAAAATDAFAIAVSIGLQYGVPLEVFVDRFVGTRSEPNGPVEGNDAIAFANSIHDYLFRELGVTHLGAGRPPERCGVIVRLDTGRLRCSGCAHEWTPWVDGTLPIVCPACHRCRGCDRQNPTPGHYCEVDIETRPQRALRNLEGLPVELIDAIRRNAPRG